jgi:hypothetical protein
MRIQTLLVIASLVAMIGTVSQGFAEENKKASAQSLKSSNSKKQTTQARFKPTLLSGQPVKVTNTRKPGFGSR